MEINIKDVDGVKIVYINGNLDTNTAPNAESEINVLLDSGELKIIINLSDTKFVSSSGLRVFLATAKKLTAKSGKLKLCSPNEVVKEILDISGFSMILDVKETEEQALSNM